MAVGFFKVLAASENKRGAQVTFLRPKKLGTMRSLTRHLVPVGFQLWQDAKGIVYRWSGGRGRTLEIVNRRRFTPPPKPVLAPTPAVEAEE